MKKVMTGMSGGVDSSAAALLLLEQGYEVTGVTMKLFSDEDIHTAEQNGSVHCALSDAEDAERAAEKLGIDHIMLDLRDSFRENVMRRFAESYLSGRTPNPCIECNRHLKFGELLAYAESLGYDYISTGHYAVIERDEHSDRLLLKRPSDRSKDQTYVLYSLTQHQLAHTLFPLGHLTKPQVRAIAEQAGLANSDKPDSQDICFVPNGRYDQFIRRFTDTEIRTGDFCDIHGNVLGEHKGIINYTIGQRKHLGVSVGRPLYVVSKDVDTNIVVLGDESELYTSTLRADDVNLISVESLTEPMRVYAKTRYRQTEQPATLSYEGNGIYRVDFDEPQRAVTSGQAVVFYNGDIVVGGGTII